MGTKIQINSLKALERLIGGKFMMKDGICIMIIFHKGIQYDVKIDRKNRKKIKHIRWYICKSRSELYVSGYLRNEKKLIKLHRFLMNAPKELQVDHKNHDTLDNRESNLRLCTHQENQCNQKIRKNNTSGFKGVSWNKQKNKWESEIKFKGKKIFLGYFTDKIEAAKAYNNAAVKYHKEFAKLNRIIKAKDIKFILNKKGKIKWK